MSLTYVKTVYASKKEKKSTKNKKDQTITKCGFLTT